VEFLAGLFGAGGGAGMGCDRWLRRAEDKLELLEVASRLESGQLLLTQRRNEATIATFRREGSFPVGNPREWMDPHVATFPSRRKGWALGATSDQRFLRLIPSFHRRRAMNPHTVWASEGNPTRPAIVNCMGLTPLLTLNWSKPSQIAVPLRWLV